MDNVRILKGYSKQEQKELEYNKKNMSCNDLLHNITYFPANVGCNPIKDKYDNADTDKRISIIRDIADYYAGVAKFAERKYYLHLIKGDKNSYLKITPVGGLVLGSHLEINGWKNKFTHEEIISMNPQLLLFEEEVEK